MRPRYLSLPLSYGLTLRLTCAPCSDPEGFRSFEARATRWIEDLPTWKALRRIDATGDRLAERALILRKEGRGTLHNFILADHGKPTRN